MELANVINLTTPHTISRCFSSTQNVVSVGYMNELYCCLLLCGEYELYPYECMSQSVMCTFVGPSDSTAR